MSEPLGGGQFRNMFLPKRPSQRRLPLRSKNKAHRPPSSPWSFIDRTNVVLQSLAAAVALLGILTWIDERQSRDLDRLARRTEVAQRAFSLINQSRGTVQEIGQSDAIRSLQAMGLDPGSLDLNDVSVDLMGGYISTTQSAGGLIILKHFGNLNPDHRTQPRNFIGTKRSSFDQELRKLELFLDCKSDKSIISTWIVFSNAVMDDYNYCISGNSYIYRLNSHNNANLLLRKPDFDLAQLAPDLRSRIVSSFYKDSTIPGRLFDSDCQLIDRCISFDFGTINMSESSISRSTMFSDHRRIRIVGSYFSDSMLILNSHYTLIDRSIVRGTEVLTPEISSYFGRYDRYISAKMRLAANKSTSAREKAVSALAAENSLAESEFLRMDDEIALMDFDRMLDFANDEFFSSESLHTVVSNSDIRGADFSSIDPRTIKFLNVCRDNNTKLPRGVKVPICSTRDQLFWNSVRISTSEHKYMDCEGGIRFKMSTYMYSSKSEFDYRFPIAMMHGLDDLLSINLNDPELIYCGSEKDLVYGEPDPLHLRNRHGEIRIERALGETAVGLATEF